MISLYKKQDVLNGETDKKEVEIRCLSTDTKPTSDNIPDISNGTVLIEIDTGKLFIYDANNKQWNEV